MKLRTKILAYSSIVILILIVLVNISIYFFFYKMSTNSELNELEVITNDLIDTLNENPNVDTSGLLKAYLPANGMIRIIEDSGNPVFQQMRDADYQTLPWEYTTQESKFISSEENAPDIAVITKPIIWRTGEVMTIQVSNHLVSLHDTLRTLFYVLAVLSVIVLIPAILAGTFLSRFLLRPIQQLIDTMQDNTRYGKWKKIKVEKRSKDELYDMEMTFNEMIDHLKESYEKQEVFVSNASHELKTPIQIVKSYAQLLKRRGINNPEVFHESVDAIDSEADRMKKLVEQMLALAKNKQPMLYDKVNLTILCKEIVTTFQGAYDREIKVEIEEKPIYVTGSKDQLEQVFYIFIENAIKYSNDNIHVRLRESEGKAFFQVEDYGQGIPLEDQEKIFDRFYRVDKARSRDTGGTGLGLSIAKSIINEHNGDVAVESEFGQGTTFTVWFPLSIE